MKKLNCKIFGHSLIKISSQTTLVKEYKCTCCNKKFTKDGYGVIVVLDAYWQQNNEKLKASFSAAS